MNNFVLEIWDDEASKCTFYTVRWDGVGISETDRFFNKYDSIPEYQGSRDLVLKWREACQFARRIEEALRNEEIIVDYRKRRIFTDDGDEEIIL